MLEYIIWGDVTVLQAIVAFVIFIVCLILSRILAFYIRRTLKNKTSKDRLELYVKIISYIVLIVGIIWALSVLGLKLSGLLVAGGVLGIVIGFASQSIVGNLVSGVFLMLERPIKIGDTVNINNVVGVVEDIQIVSTTVRTFDGFQVRMPNETVFTSSISNYVTNIVRRFEYDIGIRYDDDADQAVSIIKQLIENEPFALKNPDPLVWVNNLGDNSVNINVKIWAPVSVWWNLKTSLLWKFKKALQLEGIEIAFPQRIVWFGDKRKNNDSLYLQKQDSEESN